jgi:hypothetical protein
MIRTKIRYVPLLSVEFLDQKNKPEQRIIVLSHDQPHAVLRSNLHAAK